MSQKIIYPTTKFSSWAWRNGEYVESAAVRCKIYPFVEAKQTLVDVEIEPNEEHGWTTAKSNYYYMITSGHGIFYISKDNDHICTKPKEVKTGECFEIEAGTTYNYRAGLDGLTVKLFMNHLWEG